MIAPVQCECETKVRHVTMPCTADGAEWLFVEYEPQWTVMVGDVEHDLIHLPYYSDAQQAVDAGVWPVVPIDGKVYRLVPKYIPRGEGEE